MARLDRLAAVKAMAQLGVLGREFSYALLHAVSPWDESTLQRGLHQLVAAEFLYQQGLPPQAIYLFKHALIQDAAYQSLLRSMRQQYHQRIAHVLEERFPETVAARPSCWRITTPRLVSARRLSPTGSQPANGRLTLRPRGSHHHLRTRGLELLQHSRDPRARPARTPLAPSP